MRNMKKLIAWMLGLIMLLGLGAAAGESALPEIPEFQGTLDTRPIASEEEAIAYAKEILALDFIGVDAAGTDYTVSEFWKGENCYQVDVNLGGNGNLMVAFDPEGNVVYFENSACGFYYILEATEWEDEEEEAGGEEEADDEDETEIVAWRETLDRRVEYPFLAEVNPKVYEIYTREYPIDEGNNEFLVHYYGTYEDADNVFGDFAVFDLNYSEYYDNQTYRIKVGVQTEPVIRIVFFDVFCDPEEGGNG